MAVQTINYGDKSFLNENADIPATNKVQDSDMNEIKSVVNNNANELSSKTLSLLWSNPSPTSSFSSQTITLLNNEYDYLIIFCRFENSSNLVSQITLKGYGANFGIGWDYNGGSGSSYYSASYRRTFTYSSDVLYNVSDCYVRYSNNTSNTVVNNNVVPLFIYGGKF